jgi:hypothetical protein
MASIMHEKGFKIKFNPFQTQKNKVEHDCLKGSSTAEFQKRAAVYDNFQQSKFRRTQSKTR